MNILDRLQHWYQLHCDNDWEHSYGITIETLDNPGWKLTVDLTDTLLDNVEFIPIQKVDSENKTGHWILCRKENSRFIAMGGSNDLYELISAFLNWADRYTDTSDWDSEVDTLIDYCQKCEKIDSLREAYKKIISIPNEHVRKKELIDIFQSKWNCLINKASSNS